MLKTGVSYFGSRIARHVRADMRDIARHGCTFVVHTYSELDQEFYQGTMSEISDLSRAAGLEVWVDPWAVGGVFGGESYSKFVAVHLDARQISAKGVSLPAACLNNARFIDFMYAWIRSALEFSPDVFFWDEPHFYLYPLDLMRKDPSMWACRCAVCRKKFKKQFSYGMPALLNDDIRCFKEDSIIAFLKTMCDYVKECGIAGDSPVISHQSPEKSEKRGVGRARRRVNNALCFLPFKGSLAGIIDWSKAARIPSLDIIGTDPYWKTGEKDVARLVGRASKRVYALSSRYGKEAQIWIMNLRIKKGTEKDISVAVKTAYDAGVRNIAAWSYRGTGCMSYLASDDPEKVWGTLGRTYISLKKR
ncbi:MAG: hypothetical protein WCG78_05445 [Candidatus Omnitrophota bacterium]